MKRIIYLVIISFIQIQFISAQSLVVTGNTNVSATDPCLQAYTGPITVKNISNDTLNVLCEKIIIDTASGTSNHFCWGANCYGVSTYISTDYNTLDPGEGDAVDFTGYYDAYCNVSPAVIEYCFFPETNPADRACITINYNNSSTSISEFIDDSFYDFFPNPAKEFILFNYPLDFSADLIFIDMLGKTVKEISIFKQGQKKIDISDLHEGFYFCNLIVNSELLTTKKLIIK